MEKDAEKTAEMLLNYVNNMCLKPDAFYKALMNGHRTLQQSASRLFFGWFLFLAKQDKNRFSDLRNEASFEAGKRLEKLNEGEPFYFPFI